MQYFKHVELARLYHVSEKAVRNWINATNKGKLDLTLHNEKGKLYIANTTKNLTAIEELVQERKKFTNSRGLKTITPTKYFYELYDQEQILDIISNLETYREIPLQYSYFDGGAEYWDKYAQRLLSEPGPNTLKSTIELVESNFTNLDRLIGERQRINIIDLGVGNGAPVRGLLSYLLQRGILHRYIGIDISEEMLSVAERNIKKWFGGRVKFEKYKRDIVYDRFKDITVDDYLDGEQEPPLNIVLLFGGTLSNFRRPDDVLRVINNSMSPDDLLIYSLKLDTPNSRRYFDFYIGHEIQPLDPQLEFVLNLVGIAPSMYEVERLFDPEEKTRMIRIRLNVDISIKFKLKNGNRSVNLNKNEAILLWRARHVSAMDVIHQFDKSDFRLLQSSQTVDNEYLLTISEIKAGQLL